MPRRLSYSIILMLVLLCLAFLFNRGQSELQSLSGLTMGTSYAVQFAELPPSLPREQLAAEISDLLHHLDREVFSTYAPDSELSRFNRHPPGTPFTASTELVDVMELALELAEFSSGAFDPTVGALVDLWGFGPQLNLLQATVPDDAAIASALETVGYQHVRINRSASELLKTRAVQVDLSAIAKGYAVDHLASLLDSLGLESYFIDIGGELKIRGLKPGGIAWVAAIETPVQAVTQTYEILANRGDTIAIAGSGDYRNYFEVDGIRYSHEIDPRSGRPIAHSLAAAYVIDGSAARADALATAYMILGFDAALELATRNSQAAYFIVRDGDDFTEAMTPGFAHYLE